VDQPYTYTGREFDSESGLYYYRARFYDPTTGRFLQKDPIGYKGSGVNLYTYAFSNPINLNDPLGLYPNCGSGNQTLFIPDFDFSQACTKHDDCYGRCGANKDQCDKGFLNDMLLVCKKASILGVKDCYASAFFYYAAVRTPFGNDAFRNAQAECKGCSPSP
jgi:RHS repeat-associated protein